MNPVISKNTALSRKEKKDLKILVLFTSVFCRDHHPGEKYIPSKTEHDLPGILIHYPCCRECHDFLNYAIERRLRCPLENKPACKDCHIHCYRPGYREKIREIMRYSGKALIRKGRLDLLLHYFF